MVSNYVDKKRYIPLKIVEAIRLQIAVSLHFQSQVKLPGTSKSINKLIHICFFLDHYNIYIYNMCIYIYNMYI